MPGFELTSIPSRSWLDLSRDLVATAATPLDLPLDRLGDLLVLTTLLLTETLDSTADSRVKLRVEVEGDHLNLELSVGGDPSVANAVSQVALKTLADRHWAHKVGTNRAVGFSFSA